VFVVLLLLQAPLLFQNGGGTAAMDWDVLHTGRIVAEWWPFAQYWVGTACETYRWYHH